MSAEKLVEAPVLFHRRCQARVLGTPTVLFVFQGCHLNKK